MVNLERSGRSSALGQLENHPELARALGEYVALLPEMETIAVLMLAAIMGSDLSQDLMHTYAFAVLGRMQQNEKCETIIDCIEVLARTDPGRAAIAMPIAERMRYLNTRRNEFIHGHWQIHPVTGQVGIDTKMLNSRSKKSRVIDNVTHGMLLDEIEAVKLVFGEVAKFSGLQPMAATEMVQEFALREAETSPKNPWPSMK